MVSKLEASSHNEWFKAFLLVFFLVPGFGVYFALARLNQLFRKNFGCTKTLDEEGTRQD